MFGSGRECTSSASQNAKLEKTHRKPSNASQNDLEHSKQLIFEPFEEETGITTSNDKGKKLYKCKICEKKFLKKSYLSSHIITHTGETPFRCEFCNKGFNVRSNLNVHRRIHTGQRPHDCELCEKSFSQAGQLEYHMLIHRGEKPFMCAWCARSFRNTSGLTTHQRTHTGEKPFSCDVCKRSFSTSTSLKTHRVTHSGKMLFECPVCGREFNRKNNLNVHIKRHDKNRKYSCPECNNGFVMRAHVLKHLRKAHDIGMNEVKEKYKFLLEKSDCNENEAKMTESYFDGNNTTNNWDEIIKLEASDTRDLQNDIAMKAENTNKVKTESNERNEVDIADTTKRAFPEKKEHNKAGPKYHTTNESVKAEGSDISDVEKESRGISTDENGKSQVSYVTKDTDIVSNQAVVTNYGSYSRYYTHGMEGISKAAGTQGVQCDNDGAYNGCSERQYVSTSKLDLTQNDTKLDINIAVKSEPIFIDFAEAAKEDKGAHYFTQYIKTEERHMDDSVDSNNFLRECSGNSERVQYPDTQHTMYLSTVIKQENTD